MDRQLMASIEAILFSVGNAVEAKKLQEILDINEATLQDAIDGLMKQYAKKERGIQLLELSGSYQLCSKKDYYHYIQKATQKVVTFELTDVLIETLSIIAYKQPITKVHIEKIRGVKTDHAVNRLVEYGLVEEVGRLDSPGRPILFGTTEAFLRNFGMSSTQELPDIEEGQLQAIKNEVEEEVQRTFDDSEGE